MTAPPRHFFAGWERLFGWLLLAGLTLNVSAQPPMLTNIAAIRALGKPEHVLYDLKYLLPASDSDLRL